MRPSGVQGFVFSFFFFFSFLLCLFPYSGAQNLFLASIAARFLVTFLLKNHFSSRLRRSFPWRPLFSFFDVCDFCKKFKTCASLLFFLFF